MLFYFPAYQFPKVFKETKQNNDFQLDIISIHNTSYACFQSGDCWILIRKYSKQWNQENISDKNKKVTKTNGYFSTGCLAFLTLRLFRAASAPIIVCTIIINFSFM